MSCTVAHIAVFVAGVGIVLGVSKFVATSKESAFISWYMYETPSLPLLNTIALPQNWLFENFE